MPPLRNTKREKFCLEYAEGKSGKEAAINAGYSFRSARVTASRLLTNANIINHIRELQKQAESNQIMTIREIKEYLTKIIRARMSDFVDVNGDEVNIIINQDSPHLEGLQIFRDEIKYDKYGNPKSRITLIKLHDVIGAIHRLNKMDGSYNQRIEQNSNKQPIRITVMGETTR